MKMGHNINIPISVMTMFMEWGKTRVPESGNHKSTNLCQYLVWGAWNSLAKATQNKIVDQEVDQ